MGILFQGCAAVAWLGGLRCRNCGCRLRGCEGCDEGDAENCKLRLESIRNASLSTSRALGRLLWGDELDSRAGAVAVDEDLVCYAANVCLGYGVDLVEFAEELTPVAEAGLVLGQLMGQAFVVGEAAQKVGLGAGLEAGQLFVGDVFGLQAVEFFVDGGAHLLGGVAGEGNGVDGEEAGILVAGESAEAFGGGGDLLVADERAVEAGGAAVGEDVGDGVVDGVIGIAVVGAMVALDVEGLGGFADDDGFFGELARLDGRHGLRLGAGGDLREVTLEDGHGLAGFDVADDRDDDVGWNVILFVEGFGLGCAYLADLALPADAAATVGVGDVGGGEELLDHAADGGRVDAHATLFLNDVALLVELALDGLADALAFEIGPELEAVGGHGPEVLGGVFGGGGVHADGAVLLGDEGELIGDDEFLCVGLGVLEGFFEAGEAGGVLAYAFAEFSVIGCVGDFDFRESDLFGGVVGGADLLGSLEGHVLEHVGEAAVALGVVG